MKEVAVATEASAAAVVQASTEVPTLRQLHPQPTTPSLQRFHREPAVGIDSTETKAESV